MMEHEPSKKVSVAWLMRDAFDQYLKKQAKS